MGTRLLMPKQSGSDYQTIIQSCNPEVKEERPPEGARLNWRDFFYLPLVHFTKDKNLRHKQTVQSQNHLMMIVQLNWETSASNQQQQIANGEKPDRVSSNFS